MSHTSAYGLRGRVREVSEFEETPDGERRMNLQFDSEGWEVGAARSRPAEGREARLPDGTVQRFTKVEGLTFLTLPWAAKYGVPTGGAAESVSTFNPSGEPVRTELRNGSGQLVYRIDYSCDAAGRVVELVVRNGEAAPGVQGIQRATGGLSDEERGAVTRGAGALFQVGGEFVRSAFAYDRSGRLVEQIVSQGQVWDPHRCAWCYNDEGDVVAAYMGRPESSLLTHEYEYDEYGNWTRRMSVGPGGARTETRRRIEYWP